MEDHYCSKHPSRKLIGGYYCVACDDHTYERSEQSYIAHKHFIDKSARRDLFLAAALNGLISNYGGHTLDTHEAAKIAVAFADSLLKEADNAV